MISFIKTNTNSLSQLIGPYINPYIQKANDKLTESSKDVSYEKYLPADITSNPLNFILILSFVVIYSLIYASNIVYNLIGMIYPIAYSLYLFENIKDDTDTITFPIDKLLTINRYWILFIGIMIAEYFLYGILQFVPLYSIAKIIFIFILVRNEFSLTNHAFNFLRSVFANVEQKFKINEFIEKIKSQ